MELSLAPESITGTTGTLGHISAVTFSTAPITSGRRAAGGVAVVPAPLLITGVMEISEAFATFPSVSRISSGEWPGRMRQFMFAVALPGSALLAWAPARGGGRDRGGKRA